MTTSTKAHYEAYPFLEGGPRRIRLWADRLRADLPDGLLSGSLVLDVGCGSGEVARSLADRGARVVCVDLTGAAVRRARRYRPDITACQANALALPFPDRTFDHAMSIGVLHHTPDAFRGLAEMARVTRPGGRMVVLLYSRWTPYHLVYLATAPLRRRLPVRRIEGIPSWVLALGRPVVRFLIGQRLTDRQMKRLIADQVWTPRASFHSSREVKGWLPLIGARLVRRRRIPGYSNLLVLERLAESGR